MTRLVGEVCGCVECAIWDVATEPRRCVPSASGGPKWIHGQELRRWLDAKAEFEAAARAAVGARGRHHQMERLVSGGSR